jgi:hypothetical protein
VIKSQPKKGRKSKDEEKDPHPITDPKPEADAKDDNPKSDDKQATIGNVEVKPDDTPKT